MDQYIIIQTNQNDNFATNDDKNGLYRKSSRYAKRIRHGQFWSHTKPSKSNISQTRVISASLEQSYGICFSNFEKILDPCWTTKITFLSNWTFPRTIDRESVENTSEWLHNGHIDASKFKTDILIPRYQRYQFWKISKSRIGTRGYQGIKIGN